MFTFIINILCPTFIFYIYRVLLPDLLYLLLL